MQQTGQPPSKNWKRDAMKRAGVISDAFEVFKAWLAHFANWILFFCLIGNILQTVVSLGSELSGTLLCIQCVMLDVAGASLYTMAQHAKSEGNEKGANLAMFMSIILLIIMTVTALNGTLNSIFPSLSWLVEDVNYGLIFARIVIVVAYGNIVHQLNTSTEMHDNRIEELKQALSEKVNEVNALTAQIDTLTAQFNGQLNALQQQLNGRANEVNALRVKVNGQTEDLNALRVKLSDKEAQLASVKVNAQEEDQNGQLDTTDDLDSHKIVHLDTQTAESKNYESQIRSLLINEPGLSGGEIARRLGCSKPTACYWKKLIENEAKSEQVI